MTIDDLIGNSMTREEIIEEGYRLANKEIGYRIEHLNSIVRNVGLNWNKTSKVNYLLYNIYQKYLVMWRKKKWNINL